MASRPKPQIASRRIRIVAARRGQSARYHTTKTHSCRRRCATVERNIRHVALARQVLRTASPHVAQCSSGPSEGMTVRRLRASMRLPLVLQVSSLAGASGGRNCRNLGLLHPWSRQPARCLGDTSCIRCRDSRVGGGYDRRACGRTAARRNGRARPCAPTNGDACGRGADRGRPISPASTPGASGVR